MRGIGAYCVLRIAYRVLCIAYAVCVKKSHIHIQTFRLQIDFSAPWPPYEYLHRDADTPTPYRINISARRTKHNG